VQADCGYGDITAFRTGLEERELEYVVQVKGVTPAQPADAVPVAPACQGRGRPPVARFPARPVSLHELVRAVGRERVGTVGWREGDRGALASQFIAPRVRPANDAQRDYDGVLPELWLLAEWATEKEEPVKYWLSNPPARDADRDAAPAGEAAPARRARLPRAQAVPRPGPFAGRMFRGLHHRLTCVTAAHAFLTCYRLTRGDAHAAHPQTAAA
jgi:hypothetical protein